MIVAFCCARCRCRCFFSHSFYCLSLSSLYCCDLVYFKIGWKIITWVDSDCVWILGGGGVVRRWRAERTVKDNVFCPGRVGCGCVVVSSNAFSHFFLGGGFFSVFFFGCLWRQLTSPSVRRPSSPPSPPPPSRKQEGEVGEGRGGEGRRGKAREIGLGVSR